MKGYVDRRELTIRTHNSDLFGGIEGFIVITLPDGEVDLDEVQKKIKKEVLRRNFDGYTVHDNRTIIECGASGGGQEIIFNIILGILGNGAYDILKSLILWGKRKVKKDTAVFDINEDIDRIKNLVEKNFGKVKRFELIEYSKKKGISSYIFKIQNRKRISIDIYGDGKILNIKKLN